MPTVCLARGYWLDTKTLEFIDVCVPFHISYFCMFVYLVLHTVWSWITIWLNVIGPAKLFLLLCNKLSLLGNDALGPESLVTLQPLNYIPTRINLVFTPTLPCVRFTLLMVLPFFSMISTAGFLLQSPGWRTSTILLVFSLSIIRPASNSIILLHCKSHLTFLFKVTKYTHTKQNKLSFSYLNSSNTIHLPYS